jgi:hypothetical protein
MGNIVKSLAPAPAPKTLLPRIDLTFPSEQQPIIAIYKSQLRKELFFCIQGEDVDKTMQKINWLSQDVSDELMSYIELNIARISRQHPSAMTSVPQIVLGSNIGYPNTIFDMNGDDMCLLDTMKKLLKYMVQIDVKSDINW